MDAQTPENKAALTPELEAAVQLLQAQLLLGKSLASTSQYLKFVLAIANENLAVIRAQLETIRDLAMEVDKRDRPS